MNTKRKVLLSRLAVIVLVLLNIGCDQVSKKVVRENVSHQEFIPLIKNHFILTNVENKGAMLGFGANFPPTAKIILFQGLPLIVLLVLLYRMLTKTQTNNWMLLAFAFVIGGGIGNLIDRITVGSVTDFFQIRLGFFRTGIFNMADVAVTTGVLLILFFALSRKKITV